MVSFASCLTLKKLAVTYLVVKKYFRLPDGGMTGEGYAVNNNYQTLPKLYFGTISSISNRYGTATFTMSSLETAISEIITASQPSLLATLDYMSDYGTGE